METRPSILMKGVQEGSEGGRGREEVWEKAEESRTNQGTNAARSPVQFRHTFFTSSGTDHAVDHSGLLFDYCYATTGTQKK